MFNIEVISLNKDTLHLLKPLWNDLNEIHANKAVNFKEYYKDMNFEKRIKTILKDDLLNIKIDALMDKDINEYIGYCISTINTDLKGEIESIFIKPNYRGLKLGDTLMTNALNWLDNNNVNSKTLTVSIGNENVLGFYSKYGFYPRKILLEEV